MLTEVMRFYGLARAPIDAGFFETEHHAQVSRDIRAAIMGGRLIALTAVIGSGKTILSRRLRAELEREGKVIVSRALSVDKAKISVPLLIAALFYDLAPEKTVKISSQSERRERDLQELFRRAKKPVALFVDDAHDLHPKTLTALKRLIELVAEGGGQLSIVLVGHPKLKNDLRRPKMEEIGDRTTVFEFGGLRDRQRDYIDWVLKASLGAGFEIGAKPIDAGVVEAVLSSQLDDLEPQLTRNGYDLRSLVEQFDAKPAEIRRLLRGRSGPRPRAGTSGRDARRRAADVIATGFLAAGERDRPLRPGRQETARFPGARRRRRPASAPSHKACAGAARSRVRLNEPALSLKQRAPNRPASLNECAPEIALDCASGHSSLRAATATAIVMR